MTVSCGGDVGGRGCDTMRGQSGCYKLVDAKLASGQQLVKELDAVTCAVCLDVYHKPAYLPECKHIFCMKCIQRHAHKAEKTLCPLCRTGFDPKHVVKDRQKQYQIQNSKTQCRACFKVVTLTKLRSHSTSCTEVQCKQSYRITSSAVVLSSVAVELHHHHQRLPRRHQQITTTGGGITVQPHQSAATAAHHPHPPPPPTAQRLHQRITSGGGRLINRYTFKCPLCPVANLDVQDLRLHCDEKHVRVKQKVQCPVCAVMPWTNPNDKCTNITQHLNERHRFEYDMFVDFGLSEEEQLQRTIEMSMRENVPTVRAVSSDASSMSCHQHDVLAHDDDTRSLSSDDSDNDDDGGHTNASLTQQVITAQTHV